MKSVILQYWMYKNIYSDGCSLHLSNVNRIYYIMKNQTEYDIPIGEFKNALICNKIYNEVLNNKGNLKLSEVSYTNCYILQNIIIINSYEMAN